MAEDFYKINDTKIFQPDNDLAAAFATTYTEGSGRTQNGDTILVPLFTVEQYTYKASDIPVSEATKIFQMVALGKPFKLHYFSAYHGKWRDGTFYVGQSDTITIGELSGDRKRYSEISFSMTGTGKLK